MFLLKSSTKDNQDSFIIIISSSSNKNYRQINLWERVVEARLTGDGQRARERTTDAIFALRVLMEKSRKGQEELHCVFADLEKAYDRVQRKEVWFCMRKSRVAD